MKEVAKCQWRTARDFVAIQMPQVLHQFDYHLRWFTDRKFLTDKVNVLNAGEKPLPTPPAALTDMDIATLLQRNRIEVTSWTASDPSLGWRCVWGAVSGRGARDVGAQLAAVFRAPGRPAVAGRGRPGGL
jgi:hypothetical protein